MNPRILLVEDDQTLGYALKTYLEMNNFIVSLKGDGLLGQKAFENEVFDICVLDVMMPKMDGFMLATELKKLNPDIPIIFLTARSMKIDKLQGFQKGADDYIIKPVDEEELVARIKAVLRRSQQQINQQTTYKIGVLEFDWESRRLVSSNETIILTEKEAELLRLLCQKKNRLLNRKLVLRELWGSADYFNRRSMDVHMSKLRKYLRLDPKINLINIHGKGYILEDL
ncbi:response regulator transcription factor [Autumnicola psychrophila]|uniref:Response regulator transcription factor n=1 Tax=Autumnicola psychrophila TaxID=3075592 RepID=A0ABU3DTE8_9FLAO|nr:response regulator transcription factor [Zunongwangia sp. F225]MDT0686965.1 response regulator transcription factor [Zunongwangia sp. F225]